MLAFRPLSETLDRRITVREFVAKRKRRAGIVAYAGLAMLMIGVLLGEGHPWLAIIIPGFAVFLGANVYLLFFLRCPRCGGNIGYPVSGISGPFSVSRKVRFCPFCGVALDADLGRQLGV